MDYKKETLKKQAKANIDRIKGTKKAQKMYVSGVSLRDIAGAVGVSHETIRRWLLHPVDK
mgnify:CR=1 FL=1